MTKTRLNESSRDILLKFVRDTIVALPSQHEKETELYEKARSLVSKYLLTKYPTKEMKVLKKYGCTIIDKCIAFTMPENSSRYKQFNYRDEDESMIPIIPNTKATYNKKTPHLDETGEILDAIEALEAFREEVKEDLLVRKQAYQSLIRQSRTFEDVQDVWPEVSALAVKITASKPLMIMDSTLINKIKQDMELRGVA